uniref:Uncharacterized protein LOC113785657 n=1 Tax=Cicer arietinum TaxID=3827 RepID=A0A3Q7X2S4_CICAR|nr:uncharacterized protein LOC113785657 [Cicer arietinum]
MTLNKAQSSSTYAFCSTPSLSTQPRSQAALLVMGDRIHVVVPKDYVIGFKDTLKEHTIYIMHSCSIVDNDEQFKVCDHPYKLMFNSGTILAEEKLDQIPSHVYNFKSFGDILSGKCQSNLLVAKVFNINFFVKF